MLWNPSIRKKLVLTNPIEIPESHHVLCYGFGFVPTTNDYKIVKISLVRLLSTNNVSSRINVYELSTNSWHNVDIVQDNLDSIDGSKQVVLNSCVHWVTHSEDNLIVSFDLTSEKLGTLMCPNCLKKAGSDDYEFYTVMSFGESLCLVHATESDCDVWVMKEYGVTESWELQFNIPNLSLFFYRPLYVHDDGKLLFTSKFTGLACYDPISCKILHIRRGEQSAYADKYMESLVLLKSFSTSKRIENFADQSEIETIKKARLKK